jgi:hypothetical protein
MCFSKEWCKVLGSTPVSNMATTTPLPSQCWCLSRNRSALTKWKHASVQCRQQQQGHQQQHIRLKASCMCLDVGGAMRVGLQMCQMRLHPATPIAVRVHVTGNVDVIAYLALHLVRVSLEVTKRMRVVLVDFR